MTDPELGLSAQGLRLERSTPAETADFENVLIMYFGRCKPNASIKNLLGPTGLPQKDQSSDFHMVLTTFWLD